MRRKGVLPWFIFLLAFGAGCGAPPIEEESPTSTNGPTQTHWEPAMSGLWMRAPSTGPVNSADLAGLKALGYAPGYEPAPTTAGVALHDPNHAQAGFNLYCSGHDSEAILMDMSGMVVHRWRLRYDRIPSRVANAHPWFTGSWRRVRLLDDGSLLAIFENLALVKLSRDSTLLWTYDRGPHHDLDLDREGRIWVLTREVRHDNQSNSGPRVIEDFLVVLSPDGEELRRISLVDAFLRSDEYRPLIERLRPLRGDFFHTNTVEILDGRLEGHGPHFAEGNVLLSIRNTNTIAVLDPQSETIVWAASGSWRAQHEPTVLDNGHLLLFDNSGDPSGSRVIEFDPSTLDVTWSYQGDPPGSFYSVYCGTAQRLANGNTLITESCSGRAFEVTPSHRKVWEFVSPHRAGGDGELVAALFDLIRLSETPDWLAPLSP